MSESHRHDRQDQHRQVRILKSDAGSKIRILRDRREVVESLADTKTRDRLRQVERPNSLSRTLRKAGVALVLAPDPITAVPGAIMLGASLAMGGRDPITPSSVVEETRKLLSEMGSFL